jgi:Caspase domain
MRRVALLVGNGTFGPNSRITNLRFPPKDVHALSALLNDREVGRYDRVISLVDKRSDEILTALNELLDEERGASVLFYYSGHGKPSDDGRLYLAASNTTERLLPATGVSFSTILQMKDSYGFSRFAAILDCCFAGLGSPDIKGSEDDQLKAFTEGRGVFFLGAANATEAAKEDASLGHGILTAAIVDGLTSGQADRDGDGRVTGPDLFAWCRKFAADRGAHKPVQVNRVADDELVLAFSKRLKSDAVERVRSKLAIAWGNALLPPSDLDRLRRHFVEAPIVSIPPVGSLESAFLAYAEGRADWKVVQRASDAAGEQRPSTSDESSTVGGAEDNYNGTTRTDLSQLASNKHSLREGALDQWLQIIAPSVNIGYANSSQALVIYVRALLSAWFIVLPMLCLLFLILKEIAVALVWISLLDPDGDSSRFFFVGLTLAGFINLGVGLRFATRRRGSSAVGRHGLLVYELAPIMFSAVLLTFALAPPHAEVWARNHLISSEGPWTAGVGQLAVLGSITYALSWVAAWCWSARLRDSMRDLACWTVCGAIYGALIAIGIRVYFEGVPEEIWLFQPKEIALLACFVPWLLISRLPAELLFIGLTEDGSSSVRNWWNVLAARIGIVAAIWFVLITVLFFGSIVANALYTQLWIWLMFGAAIVTLARLTRTTSTRTEVYNDRAVPWREKVVQASLRVAATISAGTLGVGVSAMLDWVVFGGPLNKSELFHAPLTLEHVPPWPGGYWIPLALMVSFAASAVAWRYVKVLNAAATRTATTP